MSDGNDAAEQYSSARQRVDSLSPAVAVSRLGYPNPSLPLVPRVLQTLKGLQSPLGELVPESVSDRYQSLAELDVSAWEVLDAEVCEALAVVIQKAVAKEIRGWARTEPAQALVGLPLLGLASLPLNQRIKNNLSNASETGRRFFGGRPVGRKVKDPERPSIADIINIYGFGSVAVLELFGRLEMLFGPGLPVHLEENPDQEISQNSLNTVLPPALHDFLDLTRASGIREHSAQGGHEPVEPPLPVSSEGGDPVDVFDHLESRLKPREMTVLDQRWIDGRTLEAVGQLLGVTRERVRQMEKKIAKKLRHRVTGLAAFGLADRLAWVESRLFDVVGSNGGVESIVSAEYDLQWPVRSIKTWIVLNAVVGFLNPQQKGSIVNGDFGRLVFTGSELSSLRRSFGGSHEISLGQRVESIVGPTGIMLLENLLNALDRHQADQHWFGESDPAIRGNALERAGALNLLEATHEEAAISGRWVAVGLTFAAREIARAILYGSKHHADVKDGETPDSGHFRTGLRSDLMSDWLLRNSEHKSNARAINLVCERNPGVFVRTGPASWGLFAAGADAEVVDRVSNSQPSMLAIVVDAVAELCKSNPFVSKSDVIRKLSEIRSGGRISQIIDQAVTDGYLVNQQRGRPHYVLTVGEQIPLHKTIMHKKQVVRERGNHGETSRLVLAALREHPAGLAENDVLLYVRDILPDASEDSVYVYLSHTYRDVIEKTPEGYFRLRDAATESADDTTERNGLSTIEILVRVLSASNEPLSIDEITTRCNRVKQVRRSAIQTYLRSNYRKRFKRDRQDKYSLDHQSNSSDYPTARTIQRDALSRESSETVILNRAKPRPLWCSDCGKVSKHYFGKNDDLLCERCGQRWSR